MTESNTYDESNIVRLKPQEHVRLRPGMYIGGTDAKALHHLINIALDEAIDEAIAGHCDHVWITLRSNQEVTVSHNGRGLPLQPERNGKALLEVLMTETGIGRINDNYEIKAMMHGNLVYAINALSTEFKVESACEGFLLQQTYREGIPQSEIIQVRQLDTNEPTGLTITFRPDFTIFQTNEFDYEIIANRVRDLAYLLPITFTLRDERHAVVRTDEYHFNGGLADFIADLNKQQTVLHDPLWQQNAWTIQNQSRSEYTIRVNVAFQYIDSLETNIIGFANTRRTSGGSHTHTIPTVLAVAVNNRINDLKLEESFTVEEVAAGLTIVIHVIHPYPAFESHANLVLLNPEVTDVVANTVNQAFKQIEFEQFQKIVENLLANRNPLQKNEK